MTNLTDARTALIAYLAEHSPAKWIGRTGLMKYCYFLQVLKGVPLGYDFTLYSYGPFDSTVLSDLGDAEALGLIKETPFPAGYGYRITKIVSDQDLDEIAGDFLKPHKAQIDWVLAEFGTHSASDLELDSTIIYVDREAVEAGKRLSAEHLAQRVRDVKPHFTENKIRRHVEALKQKELLRGLGT